MRRFILTIATSITVLALLPAGALAGSHAQHHQRQHERRHHHVHHVSVRHERFGAGTTSSGSGSNSGATGMPAPAENAGTVQSFSGGVLTLALADGSTVSGRITDGTEIECEAADMSTIHADRDGGGGNGGNDNGDLGDHNGNDDQTCMGGNLVAGAVVRSAELRISSTGAMWDKIELIG